MRMLKYFIFPIVMMIISFIVAYFAITFYKRDKNQNTDVLSAYNYTYLVIAGSWFALSLYYFSYILRQLI